RARYMDAGTGRFVSQDPAGDGANWFVYADNDPVNAYDPDGKTPHSPNEATAIPMGAVLYAAGISVMAIDYRRNWEGYDFGVGIALVGFAMMVAGFMYEPWGPNQPWSAAVNAAISMVA